VTIVTECLFPRRLSKREERGRALTSLLHPKNDGVPETHPPFGGWRQTVVAEGCSVVPVIPTRTSVQRMLTLAGRLRALPCSAAATRPSTRSIVGLSS
jgi:hypothetical protein